MKQKKKKLNPFFLLAVAPTVSLGFYLSLIGKKEQKKKRMPKELSYAHIETGVKLASIEEGQETEE